MEKVRYVVSPLAQVERETLEEGREWMRQRLQEKLQAIADAQGDLSPPEPVCTDAQQTTLDSSSDGLGSG